jgi:hypothetical protein
MNDTPNWERQLVEKLAMAAVVEQRRARRWKIFFRLVWLGIIGGLLATAFLRNEDKSAEALTGSGHTAVISLDGVIDSENNTAEKLSAALEDAYNDHGTRGIIIEANSPGGSPVLSGMAYDEIRRLKKAASGHSGVCHRAGSVRLWLLLHCRRCRQDLCRQGQHHRLDRRTVGRLWLYRPDGQAGRGAPPENRW